MKHVEWFAENLLKE